MMIRTASGLVEVTPMLRSAGGLVTCGNGMFRGTTGTINIGSSAAGGGGALAASAAPAEVYGARNSISAVVVQTQETIASVTGGKALFSYAWSQVSGGSWTIQSPTGSSTRFSILVASGSTQEGEFQCTVTDAAGAVAHTGTVTAQAENFGGNN